MYAIPDDNKELIETIEKLSKQYELVLLSNYFEKSQRGRLKHIGIDKYFTEYYGEKICKPSTVCKDAFDKLAEYAKEFEKTHPNFKVKFVK